VFGKQRDIFCKNAYRVLFTVKEMTRWGETKGRSSSFRKRNLSGGAFVEEGKPDYRDRARGQLEGRPEEPLTKGNVDGIKTLCRSSKNFCRGEVGQRKGHVGEGAKRGGLKIPMKVQPSLQAGETMFLRGLKGPQDCFYFSADCSPHGRSKGGGWWG